MSETKHRKVRCNSSQGESLYMTKNEDSKREPLLYLAVLNLPIARQLSFRFSSVYVSNRLSSSSNHRKVNRSFTDSNVQCTSATEKYFTKLMLARKTSTKFKEMTGCYFFRQPSKFLQKPTYRRYSCKTNKNTVEDKTQHSF